MKIRDKLRRLKEIERRNAQHVTVWKDAQRRKLESTSKNARKATKKEQGP